MKPFIRSPYNYDAYAVSLASGTSSDLPSLTVQSDTPSADINRIVRSFGVSSIVQGVARPPLGNDFYEAFDFQSSMNLIVQARESFELMSPATRLRFANDPGLFVEFCSNPDNLDEMRKMGLAVPAPLPDTPPEPMLVRVVPDPLKS